MSLTRKTSPLTGLVYWSNKSPEKARRLVFCIPGLGSPSTDYLPLLENLAKQEPDPNYAVVDLPGQGESLSSLCPNPTVSSVAKMLVSLYYELSYGDGSMVLLGHSMGCRLALETFSQAPNLVRAVILLDGSWHGQKPVPPLPDPLPPRDVQVQYMLQGLEGMFGPHTPKEFKERQRSIFLDANLDLEYLGQMQQANRRWDAESMLAALQVVESVNKSHHSVRLLLIQGTDGAGGPRRQLKKGEQTVWMRTARENAGSAYSSVVVEESGHWPHIDKPAEVEEAILDVISDKT